MKGYTATLPNGEAIFYSDRKRWFWLLSVLLPLEPVFAIWLHWMTGNEWWLALPLAFNYLFVPIVDWIAGEDDSSPPQEVVMQLDQDLYYRRLTYIAVPLHFVALITAAWYAATQDLTWLGFVVLAVVTGMTSGLAINTGHELGHKNSQLEKWLARIVLAVPAYGHFTLDHNRGHHRNVSTPEDHASSRMGESIYRFALREIPGALLSAWSIEKDRLLRRGKPAWHPNNQILQSYALTAILTIALVAAFGWSMVPFLIVHAVFAYFMLTSANYVEHYGLLRQRDENGRFERCEPHHSWNSNYTFSNLLIFHLQRHSDHHANPLRRYQALRSYDDLPTLPFGYFTAFLLAYFPSLWYRVMDRRLLALPHIDGDLDRVNIDPRSRPAIFLRYGRDKMREPTLK